MNEKPIEISNPTLPTGRVKFTLYQSATPNGKRYVLDEDEKGNLFVAKDPESGVGLGKHTKMWTIGVDSLTELVELRETLTCYNAATWGVTSVTDARRVVLDGRDDHKNGLVSVTKGNFAYPAGPAFLMLDYDPQDGEPALSGDEWRAHMAAVCPALGEVGMVTCASSSNGIEGLKSGGGMRSYVIVESGQQIKEIGERLEKLLWASGLGYIKVNAVGGALKRTIIDTSVFQPTKLDYVGPPGLGAGVKRNPIKPFVREGRDLELHDVRLLNGDQEEAYERHVSTLTAAARPEMDRKAAEWIANRPAELTEDEATRITQAAKRGETLWVPDEFVLKFEGGKTITVGEVLASPQAWNRKAKVMHPFYGSERGKGIIYTLPRRTHPNERPQIAFKDHGEHQIYLGKRPEKTAAPTANAEGKKAAPKSRSHGWEVIPGKGVFVKKKEKGDGGNFSEFTEFVCSELKILARTEDVNGRDIGGNDGVLVELQHQREKDTRQLWLAMDRVHSAPELKLDLVRAGLYVNTAVQTHTALLSRYINENLPDKWVDASEKTGWCKGSFVLPQETVGPGEVVLQSTGGRAEYAPGGTLEGWQEAAKLSAGNPVAVLSLSTAFAAPLLRGLGIPGAGLHLFGDSSSGKSTCAEWAASVWGGEGYTHKWNATANGLEGLALGHNDTLLYLDEIARADPDVLAGSIYALADGKGREKLNKNSTSRPAATWRVFVLSTGEKTAETYCGRSKVELDAGQDIRLVNVEAVGAHGAFDSLHGHSNGEGLALAVKAGIGRHYGHAGRAFVAQLITEATSEDLVEAHQEVRKEFDAIPGQESRVARVFATVALGGELAAQWGIVPWEAGEATRAAVKAFTTWKDDRSAAGGLGEDARILEKITACLNAHGGSRFQKIDTADAVRDQMGYWDTDAAGRRFYLFTASGLQAATQGYAKKRVIQALEKAGAIVKHQNNGAGRPPRPDVRTWLATGYERLYYVAPWMLSGDADLAVPPPVEAKVPFTIVK